MKTHISFFSGIGGFDLTARWVGWKNIAHVEKDHFCRKVLMKNFPESQSYEDIKEFYGMPYRGTIDIVSGGFPCQPFSTAGKRKGAADDRHLWPEYFRAICEIQPAWMVGENVAGILSMDHGRVIEKILTDLESQGYAVQSFLIPASAVGAIHRRDRVWIVAYNAQFDDRIRQRKQKIRQTRQLRICTQSAADSNADQSHGGGLRRRKKSKNPFLGGIGQYGAIAHTLRHDGRKVQLLRRKTELRSKHRQFCEERLAAYANFARSKKRQNISLAKKTEQSSRRINQRKYLRPTFSPVCGADDGFSPGLDANRRQRLKALGNAIVPQVAFEIFAAIDNSAFPNLIVSK